MKLVEKCKHCNAKIELLLYDMAMKEIRCPKCNKIIFTEEDICNMSHLERKINFYDKRVETI